MQLTGRHAQPNSQGWRLLCIIGILCTSQSTDTDRIMLDITNNVSLSEDEIELQAIRAQGSGGQKVNKTSCAVHLRFDINASSLPNFYKEALCKLKDRRVSNDGIIVIKAQKYRSLDKNRQDALERLKQMCLDATVVKKSRKPTRPSKNSQKKRMDSKTKHSRLKDTRRKIDY